jgi:hypothetical protein
VFPGQNFTHFIVAPAGLLVLVVLPFLLVLIFLVGGAECFEPSRLEIRAVEAAAMVMPRAVLDISKLIVIPGCHDPAQTWHDRVGEGLLEPWRKIILVYNRETCVDRKKTYVFIGSLTHLEELPPERLALSELYFRPLRAHTRRRQCAFAFQ